MKVRLRHVSDLSKKILPCTEMTRFSLQTAPGQGFLMISSRVYLRKNQTLRRRQDRTEKVDTIKLRLTLWVVDLAPELLAPLINMHKKIL